MYNFRSLSDGFPTIIWSLIFHITTLQIRLFSYNKGNLKFSIQKCDAERNQENSLFRNIFNCI